MADEHGNMPSDEALWGRLAPRGRRGGAGGGSGPCPTPGDLAAFIDGRASPDERQRIEQHLAECDECLAALRDARDVLAAGPAVAPRRLVARAKALVPAAAPPRVRWRVAARWAAAAAAAAVIALAGFFAGASTYRSREATETRVAREVSFGLADGADEALAVEAQLFAPAAEGGER
jgi:anti-sigma factor RsiW